MGFFAPVPPGSSARVEVEKSPGTFYLATVRDVTHERYLVQYDDFPSGADVEWVGYRSVRAVPPTALVNPNPGQWVEVKVLAGEQEPYSWREACVKTIRGGYYLVTFGAQDELVDKDRLRPAFSRYKLVNTSVLIMRRNLTIPASLRPWLETDGMHLMAEIQQTSGAVVAFDAETGVLSVVGNEKHVHSACMLFDVHIKHQTQLVRLRTERQRVAERELELLEGRDAAYLFRTEFVISPDLRGLMFGKGGRNLNETKKATEVTDIRVDRDTGTVTIYGPSQESVDEARSLLEYVQDEVEFADPRMIAWVIGRNGRSVQELQAKTGVRADIREQKLLLTGRKDSVEDAKLWIKCHMQYQAEYEAAMPPEEAAARRQVMRRNRGRDEAEGGEGAPRQRRERPPREPREPRERPPREPREPRERPPREPREKQDKPQDSENSAAAYMPPDTRVTLGDIPVQIKPTGRRAVGLVANSAAARQSAGSSASAEAVPAAEPAAAAPQRPKKGKPAPAPAASTADAGSSASAEAVPAAEPAAAAPQRPKKGKPAPAPAPAAAAAGDSDHQLQL